MRTTLKRGIGRVNGLNGNGHSALPPAFGPIVLYRQPDPPRRSVVGPEKPNPGASSDDCAVAKAIASGTTVGAIKAIACRYSTRGRARAGDEGSAGDEP